MSSALEQLGFQTRGLIETVKPFESWQGSPIQNWTVTIEMLTMGDLIEIGNLTSGLSSVELAFVSKVYILAKSLKSINGQSIITSEDVEKYNKNHNLTGKDSKNIFDLKCLMIKQFSEVLVNRLVFMYDEVQEKYLSQLLGKPLPDELKPNINGVNLSSVGDKSNADSTSADTAPTT